MNFESFFETLQSKDIEIDTSLSKRTNAELLSNEALFQLPFISMVILFLSKERSKPKLNQIGSIVGECIEDSIDGFKGSFQHLGWSANLRIRTVNALTFLENANLVEVNKKNETLTITDLGKKVISYALNEDDLLSITLTKISRAYRNIRITKQLEMELI